MADALRPFHLAIPVHDLALADSFYGGVLGCTKGRFSSRWIDWDFWGHQLVTHQVPAKKQDAGANNVDGEQVSVPHFGVVMTKAQWSDIKATVEKHNIPYVIKPTLRFAGEPGEQGTFFIRDYSENLLEFKYFDDLDSLFKAE